MHPYHPSPDIVARGLRRRGPQPFTCDPRKTALLVVDMQNYFVAEGFPLQVPAARGIVENINAAASALRAAGGKVVWIQTSAAAALSSWGRHHRDGLTPQNAQTRLQNLDEGHEGYKLYAPLAVEPQDLRIRKTQFSAFIGQPSGLRETLDQAGIDTVFVTGTLTNVCCDSTARDAMMLDYRVVMVSDGNGALTDAEHAATLDTFQVFFGWVMTTQEAIACWK